MSEDSIVEYRTPEDKQVLEKAGYPVIPLTPDERRCQVEIFKKNTPSSFGMLLDRTFPPGILGAFLLIVLVWSTIFPLMIVVNEFFLQSSMPGVGNFLTYSVPTLFSIISFVYAVLLRFRPFSHKVYDAIMGLYYCPLPQYHTRGRKILDEAYNISEQILDSFAWREGIAVKSRDIRGEIVDVIQETMSIYKKNIREVEGHDEDFERIHRQLDSIRHYARYEMTAQAFGAPVTQPIDIQNDVVEPA